MEISVTTRAAQAITNVKKCLAAGYEKVIALFLDETKLKAFEELMAKDIGHLERSIAMDTSSEVMRNNLPESGLLRLWQILGDRRRGIPPIIPVSKSTWWTGVKSGKYPKSVKLSARCTCWRVEDIRALLERVS